MRTSPSQQLRERRCTSEMNKKEHQSEMSAFSNLTDENPRPSSSLKQDSSNYSQSRHLSYSRHSCCNGSLELHLHVIGVKDYICIHVKDNTYPRACLLWKFKLRTDPRGTITTFCANTKPKCPKIFTTGKS